MGSVSRARWQGLVAVVVAVPAAVILRRRRKRAHRETEPKVKPPVFASRELGLIHGYMWGETVGLSEVREVTGGDIPPELRRDMEARFSADSIDFGEYWGGFVYGTQWFYVRKGWTDPAHESLRFGG